MENAGKWLPAEVRALHQETKICVTLSLSLPINKRGNASTLQWSGSVDVVIEKFLAHSRCSRNDIFFPCLRLLQESIIIFAFLS